MRINITRDKNRVAFVLLAEEAALDFSLFRATMAAFQAVP